MKRLLCFLLALLCIPCFWGCAQNQDVPENAIVFYYRHSDPAYGNSGNTIAKEYRDSAKLQGDIHDILSTYLKGPEDTQLHRTFPVGIRLISVNIHDNTADIVLGGTYSALTGLNQSMACACLTLTTCELLGIKQVQIRRESETPDGANTVILRPENIVLNDNCTLEIDTN